MNKRLNSDRIKAGVAIFDASKIFVSSPARFAEIEQAQTSTAGKAESVVVHRGRIGLSSLLIKTNTQHGASACRRTHRANTDRALELGKFWSLDMHLKICAVYTDRVEVEPRRHSETWNPPNTLHVLVLGRFVFSAQEVFTHKQCAPDTIHVMGFNGQGLNMDHLLELQVASPLTMALSSGTSMAVDAD